MRGVMSSKKHDPVNFPSHYNKGDIGCIDAIKSCQGDGFRYYLTRLSHKICLASRAQRQAHRRSRQSHLVFK